MDVSKVVGSCINLVTALKWMLEIDNLKDICPRNEMYLEGFYFLSSEIVIVLNQILQRTNNNKQHKLLRKNWYTFPKTIIVLMVVANDLWD